MLRMNRLTTTFDSDFCLVSDVVVWVVAWNAMVDGGFIFASDGILPLLFSQSICFKVGHIFVSGMKL